MMRRAGVPGSRRQLWTVNASLLAVVEADGVALRWWRVQGDKVFILLDAKPLLIMRLKFTLTRSRCGLRWAKALPVSGSMVWLQLTLSANPASMNCCASDGSTS